MTGKFSIFKNLKVQSAKFIKIYTDARSLIYAKRMSTHSVLLNSTLNYLTNFVSMLNISIYHIPGSINVLADVLSRAISDNLNCNIPREHPISRKWAAVLPPLPQNFGVPQDTIFEFLTRPLRPFFPIFFENSRRYSAVANGKNLQSEKGYASQLLLKCKTLSVQPLIRSDETDL